MSQSESSPATPSSQAQTQPLASSNMVNPKGATVAPKLSEADDTVEMKSMLQAEEASQDIMQLARLGDIAAIQQLYDSGKFHPTHCDAEGITPLHWAAINNQYAMCKFLLEAGADVNKKGGESVATAAMWAAQRCHYYTVHLLLQYGADPLIVDIQGYNILHLATFEGNVFLLILLLHQNIQVDVPDNVGHTCLMWAAYKGLPVVVDLFLRWGADVHKTDETGFTALHWALVKGSPGCIQKLIEYGSDRFQKASNGKTPDLMAEEMKTVHAWHKALRECGYTEEATPMSLDFPLSTWLFKDKRAAFAKLFYFWPFLIIWAMLMISSHMVVFAGVPIALIAGYFLQYVAQLTMPYAPSDMRHIHRTPWLAGIFSGTLFFVGLNWLTTILPSTYSDYPATNFAFASLYGLCAYFYFCSMFYEPGYVPKLKGLKEQKDVIDELLSLWKFDDQNFCVPCMVRMPLRSKHCKRCNRCIAKHDHHCPWVYNCIGVNNHRQFFLYLITLEIGICLIIRLAIGYYSTIGGKASSECNILAPALCKLVNTDAYTLVLITWSALQLTWVTMLLFVQLVQIARAMTTYENMRGSHHGSSSHAAGAITSALAAGTTSMAGAGLGPGGRGPDPVVANGHEHHGHNHKDGCFKQWKKILGVDTFVETAMNGYEGNKSHRRKPRNPFSRGCVRNCKDFWCDPAPIFGNRDNGAAILDGVPINYTDMYETPLKMTATPQRRAVDGGGAYASVRTDDAV